MVLFPNVKVVLLMGDVAIRAFDQIARHIGQKPVIPAAPTYKIRKQEFFFGGRRVLPSYLQVGPSVGIEKGKRKIIAEDIALGLRLAAN